MMYQSSIHLTELVGDAARWVLLEMAASGLDAQRVLKH